MKGVEEFAGETYYCNFKHPLITQLARRLTADCPDKKTTAVKLFYWVRDNVLYRVGDWNRRASETLIERGGSCTNKANLLVALLRAAGVPAGYRVLRVKGQEYFGPIIPPILKQRVSESSVHAHAYVFLDGRWIKCDPSDDVVLSLRTSYFNPQSTIVEWDGEKDAVLNLDPNHIIEDLGLASNIDHFLNKKPKRRKKIAVRLGNLYLKFLREYEETIDDIHKLELQYKRWLRRNHFIHYILLHVDNFLHHSSRKI